MWSKVELRNVTLHADGKGPAPIEQLKVDRVAVDYDLWKLIHSDWRHVFRRVEVGTLDGALRLHAKVKSKPRTPIADAFAKILSSSLSPVEYLSVGRADFEVKGIAAIHGLQAEVSDMPGFVAWEKLHVVGFPDFGAARAELVTNQSVIAISKLPLLPQIIVRRLSLNRITETLPRGGLEVLLEAGGGTAGLKVEPSVTPGALDVSVNVDAVQLNEVAAPFGFELPSPSAIESFRATFTGAPENLATSTADVAFVFRTKEELPFPAAIVRGEAKWGRGVFRITELAALSSGAELLIGGELNVPLDDFTVSRLGGEITWKLSGADLAAFHLRGLPGAQGAMSGAGTTRFENGEATTTGTLRAMKVSQGKVTIDTATIQLGARRKIGTFSDVLAGLAANLSLEARGVVASGARVDAISVTATMDGQTVGIEQLSVASGQNRFTGSGSAMLKPNAAGLAGKPEIELSIAAPRLEQLGVVVNGAALSGAVTAGGKLRLEGTHLVGNLKADGTDLRLGATPIGEFHALATFADGALILDSLKVALAAGEITARGRASLEAPMDYTGELHVKLASLGKLDALLATAGHPAKLGGALTLDWSGDGRLSESAHNGKLRVIGKGVRRDALTLNEVRLGAAYSPLQFETNELLVVSDKTRIGGRIRWKDARLDLSDLSISIAGEQAVGGNVSIPLNPSNPKGALPLDEPISAKLTARNADIAQILASVGVSAPVSGKVSGGLTVGGTLAMPDVNLSISGRSLTSSKAASVAPAELDAKLNIADSRLTVDAILKQRDIQPITLSASVPFVVEKLRRKPELMRELPLQGSLKVPASSLAILPRFVPALARIDGTVAANVEVAGTVGSPVVSGEVSLATQSIRMASANVPPISNFKGKLIFRDDTVTLSDTRGEIGGGTFRVDGSVNIAQPAQPAFDLRLRSDKVLVRRDDFLTIRTDADVTLRGPLNAATAAGTVYVTQSRFLKDVDILPLSLPGQELPRARSVATPMRISFPNPPLRDWKFDIAIKTRERDSFLVRGNLAKGAVSLNLRLGGTGLNPFLTGQAPIENFTAILPVSKLEVKRGFVTFSEDDPFQPQLYIEAQSRIGKTTVTANISGPASGPRLDLTSEPPLPQRDILSLLATGTTTDELGSNASVLATKAALLTVKGWYRKIFRKGADEPVADGEESFADRFDLDVTNVDPKTGRPEVTGSMRVTDKVYFLGELDTEGQFTGKVRYLLRFR